MAESWQLIDGHRSSDGLTYTAVYWCSNTGAIKTETTSDGRVRAGDGPRIKRPTQAVEIDQLRQRVAELELLNRQLRQDFDNAAWEAESKLALAEQDARRYRWLRDWATVGLTVRRLDEFGDCHQLTWMTGKQLDNNIDAAMRAAIDASGHDSPPPHKEGG